MSARDAKGSPHDVTRETVSVLCWRRNSLSLGSRRSTSEKRLAGIKALPASWTNAARASFTSRCLSPNRSKHRRVARTAVLTRWSSSEKAPGHSSGQKAFSTTTLEPSSSGRSRRKRPTRATTSSAADTRVSADGSRPRRTPSRSWLTASRTSRTDGGLSERKANSSLMVRPA